LISIAATVVLAVSSLLYFRSVERFIADLV
jgi:hypothetical protein